ncbi:MAG: aminoglycoside phosphotransferase family protein [Bacteroidales bacterium]|nr:aminoglycoside phosphotransferase family protein [Bacteroidales bacterium]
MDFSIQKILENFSLQIKPEGIIPIGEGLINTTYGILDNDGDIKYVLQRINHHVFTNVDVLQQNIQIVTEHIRNKILERGEKDIDRKVLRLIPALNGDLYYFDSENYWRIYNYISDSITLNELTSGSSFLSGKMFGEFQYMLSDLPEKNIAESIPGFHNMRLRLSQFRQAIEEDKANRAVQVKHIIKELEKRASEYCVQEELFEKGQLPKRINHCDTKLNNILFDKKRVPLCVVDLDTVMPGFVLSDFGDFIRTGGNKAEEDESDLSKIKLNQDIILAYADGYLSKAAAFLTEGEINLLSYGPSLQTYMQTVRFFTDYLNGDVYYKIKHPLHNLQRTYAQFRLLQLFESSREAMGKTIYELYLKYKT